MGGVEGVGARRHIRKEGGALDGVARMMRTGPAELPGGVGRLLEERGVLQRELDQLKRAQAGEAAGDLMQQVREIGGTKVLGVRVDGIDAKVMRSMIDDLRNKLGSGAVCLLAESGGKVVLAIGITKDMIGTHKAGDLIREVAGVVGGGGGGRPDFAQAGGSKPAKIDAAIAKFYELVHAK